jgi:hypothetical protein
LWCLAVINSTAQKTFPKLSSNQGKTELDFSTDQNFPDEKQKKNRPGYRDTVWTIQGRTPLDGRYKKWKFDLQLDARQTLVSGTRARLGGLRIGLEYRRVNRFGVGFYTLGDGIQLNSLREISTDIDSAVVNLGYRSLFYERVLYFHRKWEWSASIHQGVGTISGTYRYRSTGATSSFSRTVKPSEISSTLYFNVTYFLSVGAGVGYRYMRSTPEEVRPIYNAPIGIFRVRLKLIKMTRGFFSERVRNSY